jgi:hypothetical protein
MAVDEPSWPLPPIETSNLIELSNTKSNGVAAGGTLPRTSLADRAIFYR